MEDLSFKEALIRRYAKDLAEEIHERLVREGKVVVADDGDTILYFEDEDGNVLFDHRDRPTSSFETV